MPVVRGIIVPHPPIIVPEVGRKETEKVKKTVKAMEEIALTIKDLAPDVLVFITPHGTVFQDAVAITTVPELNGNLAQFGASQVKFTVSNDVALAKEISRIAHQSGIIVAEVDERFARQYDVSSSLDHGIMVPLHYFSQAGISCPVVPIAMGLLPREELYQFGIAISQAVEKTGRRAIVVASGDLSHRLTKDAPAGYNPRGQEFDNLFVARLQTGKVEDIINLPDDLTECAGECGLRPIVIMLGAFDGQELDVKVKSYEGPFGVGYLVADLLPGPENESRKILNRLLEQRQTAINSMREKETEPVRLARLTLEEYIQTGKINKKAISTDVLGQKAGVFVSIKKFGQLRGCIGTIEPTKATVAEEIIANAISAGTRDPRFNPVEVEELQDLTYSVDILYPPEPVAGFDDLDPAKYGVIVKSGRKTGLLLPNLEGVNTAEEQVAITMKKAGIRPGERIEMERFEVVRYH